MGSTDASSQSTETTLSTSETSSGSVETTSASITSEPSSTTLSVSQSTVSSTTIQITTQKFCDEMEYIDTLLAINSVKILPTDISNKPDLISKGVNFTDKNPTIQIDIPNGGATVRDIDLTASNVAQIGVTFIDAQGRQTGPIEGGPTSLPTSQFPAEKVTNIIINIIKTTDGDAPEDVTLSVVACAEGKTTTIAPSKIFPIVVSLPLLQLIFTI